MTTSERTLEARWILVVFALCLTLMLTGGYVRRVTWAPEDARRAELLERIAESEVSIFDAIEHEGVYAGGDAVELRASLQEAETLREEAQQLWDSIPAGEVIARRGRGGTRRVGRNEEVGELRERAAAIERRVSTRKRDVARDHGHLLLGTAGEQLWQDHQRLVQELDSLHARNAWYYNTWRGSVVSIAWVLSSIVFFVSFFFCFLFVLPAIGSLFVLVTSRPSG